MEIDLKKTKTVCISLKESNRRPSVTRLLNTLGYKRWDFFDAKVGVDVIEGCALSHIDVISHHDFKEPLLVVEDDVCDSPYYDSFISCPDDADAIYVGYSSWGWDKTRARQSTLEESTSASIENRLYRVHNMLSAHAILYISQKYAKAAIYAMITHLNDKNGNRHCDVALAKIQKDYKVYATPKHMFFQMCPRNRIWTDRCLCEKDSY